MDFIDKCGTCFARFSSNCRRIKHEKRHADVSNTDYIHKCATCSHSYNSEQALRGHSAGKCRKTKIKCRICKQIVETEYEIKRHFRNVCPPTMKELDDYVDLKWRRKPHPCPTCGEVFLSNNERADHMRKHTLGRQYRYFTCDQCFETFYSQKLLDEHVAALNHYSGNCSYCKASLSNRKEYWMHKFLHETENMVTPCVLCRENFTREGIPHPRKICSSLPDSW